MSDDESQLSCNTVNKGAIYATESEKERAGTSIIHSGRFGDPQRLVDRKVRSRLAGRSGPKKLNRNNVSRTLEPVRP